MKQTLCDYCGRIIVYSADSTPEAMKMQWRCPETEKLLDLRLTLDLFDFQKRQDICYHCMAACLLTGERELA